MVFKILEASDFHLQSGKDNDSVKQKFALPTEWPNKVIQSTYFDELLSNGINTRFEFGFHSMVGILPPFLSDCAQVRRQSDGLMKSTHRAVGRLRFHY